jgi:hypothetical protein
MPPQQFQRLLDLGGDIGDLGAHGYGALTLGCRLFRPCNLRIRPAGARETLPGRAAPAAAGGSAIRNDATHTIDRRVAPADRDIAARQRHVLRS